jgi:5-methylthioadenosine/S-adenosylhomocysteine deaminase
VMIDGQFVMRNRKILTVDEDRVVADADRVGRRIWTKVLEAGPLTVPRLSRHR